MNARTTASSLDDLLQIREWQTGQPSVTPLKSYLSETNNILSQHISKLTSLTHQLRVLLQRRYAERSLPSPLESASAPPRLETCPICFEPFHAPGTCATRCGHVFHRTCLQTSLRSSHPACPVCRAFVHEAELVDLKTGFAEEQQLVHVIDLVHNEPMCAEPIPLDIDLGLVIVCIREEFERSTAFDLVIQETHRARVEAEKRLCERERSLETDIDIKKHELQLQKSELVCRETRIRVREEALNTRHAELTAALCDVRKCSSDLDVREKQVAVDAEENDVMRKALDEERIAAREKEFRMNALLAAREHRSKKETEAAEPTRVLELERILRRHAIPIPRKASGSSHAETSVSPLLRRETFKVDLSDDFGMVANTDLHETAITSQPPKRRNMISGPSLFGSGLLHPSRNGRVAPLRKKNAVGIQSFAPTKRPVQRPTFGIGKARGSGRFRES